MRHKHNPVLAEKPENTTNNANSQVSLTLTFFLEWKSEFL